MTPSPTVAPVSDHVTPAAIFIGARQSRGTEHSGLHRSVYISMADDFNVYMILRMAEQPDVLRGGRFPTLPPAELLIRSTSR